MEEREISSYSSAASTTRYWSFACVATNIQDRAIYFWPSQSTIHQEMATRGEWWPALRVIRKKRKTT